MTWHDKIIYIRDFAYPTRKRRLRMANTNIGDAPAPTLAELLSGPLVDIYVGNERRHWSLHRNLLCHHSEQLSQELLPSKDNKSPELRLELPEDDPSGFELLVKWLYQGKLEDVSEIVDPYEKFEHAMSLHKLYLLCNRFDLPQLKNLAMDQFRKGLHEAELVPDANEINDIYCKSPEGSPFRLLMVKIAARQIMDPGTEKDAESYRVCMVDNPSFAIELVNAIRSGSGGILFDDPTDDRDECNYHDHNDYPGHITGAKEKQGNLSTTNTGSQTHRLPFTTNFRKPPTPPDSPIEDHSTNYRESRTPKNPDTYTASNATADTTTTATSSPCLGHSASWAQIEPDHRLMASISPTRERAMGSSVSSSNGSLGFVTASQSSSFEQGHSWQKVDERHGEGGRSEHGGGQREISVDSNGGGDGEEGQRAYATPADTPAGTPRRNAHPPKLRRKTGEASPAGGAAGHGAVE